MDKVLSEPSENRVVGLRQVKKAINNNRLRCVMIAMDTDELIKTQLINMCEKKKLPLEFFSSKAEMGRLLGIDVACSVLGIRCPAKTELS